MKGGAEAAGGVAAPGAPVPLHTGGPRQEGEAIVQQARLAWCGRILVTNYAEWSRAVSIRCRTVVGAGILGLLPITACGAFMPQDRSTTEPVDDRVIVVSAHVPVEPEEAFRYFTEDHLLERWLTAEADVEPRVGGPYQLYWEPGTPEDNSTIGCRVTAVAPGQLLAFQWRSPKQFKAFANAADPLTHVVVSFALEDGGARVHLVHSGWRSGAEWEAARAWQERAWSGALNKLVEVVRGGD